MSIVLIFENKNGKPWKMALMEKLPHTPIEVYPNVKEDIKDRLAKHKIDFVYKPQKRCMGKKGEQQTMFILDFSNNPLEFKNYENKKDVFQ